MWVTWKYLSEITWRIISSNKDNSETRAKELSQRNNETERKQNTKRKMQILLKDIEIPVKKTRAFLRGIYEWF